MHQPPSPTSPHLSCSVVHRGSGWVKVVVPQRLDSGQRRSPMPTQCSATGMAFGRAAGRNLVAAFDGGLVTSEAGALLLGATDQAIRLVDRFARAFVMAGIPRSSPIG